MTACGRFDASLRETGESLVETQRARRQIDETMRNEPIKFASFSDRVYGLGPRIETMKADVDATMAAQREYLQSIAVTALRTQKQRLDTYTLQADSPWPRSMTRLLRKRQGQRHDHQSRANILVGCCEPDGFAIRTC